MESGIHHPHGTVQAHHHVLWVLQCSPHIPGIHEPHLHRHAEREMAENLHGQSRNPHQEWYCPPPWVHLKSPSITLRTWTINQTLQMCIWYPSHGISEHDHWTRGDQNGWKEGGSHREIETSHLNQGSSVLHWIHKLLQKIHLRLLQHCHLL